jgi:hypothetical protein
LEEKKKKSARAISYRVKKANRTAEFQQQQFSDDFKMKANCY